ncbi:6208_t:CDS:2, partial [Rhizophagus irregularis]
DECNGAVIAEFIGLRPKMYSILKVGDETTNLKYGIRKAKGVPSKSPLEQSNLIDMP